MSPTSSLFRRLHDGIPCYALGIRNARTPDIVRMAARTGYAVVWIDLEHSTMSLDEAAAMARTAQDLGIAGWVRIADGDYGMIGRMLDGGASGIILPNITDAGTAAAAARYCRFPPRGERSQNPRLPLLGFADPGAVERNEQIDSQMVVQVLIESGSGIANCAGIAAAPGVDLVGIGLNDLSANLGRPGESAHPEVMSACRSIIAAASGAGKPTVVGGVRDAAQFSELWAMGALPLVLAGIDTDLLFRAVEGRLAAWSRDLVAPSAGPGKA